MKQELASKIAQIGNMLMKSMAIFNNFNGSYSQYSKLAFNVTRPSSAWRTVVVEKPPSTEKKICSQLCILEDTQCKFSPLQGGSLTHLDGISHNRSLHLRDATEIVPKKRR